MDALAPIPTGSGYSLTQTPSPSTAVSAGAAYSLFPALGAPGTSTSAAAPATVGSGPGGALSGAGASVAPASLAPLIDQVAQAHGLPASLLRALVQEESGFNPNARSSAGAMGLTQLMPGTAATLGVTDPWDPVENLNGGATYLAGLLQDYGGNVSLALAAYNAGPGAVSQWGGIPPYPETQAYVRNVMALAGIPGPGQAAISGAAASPSTA